MIVIEQSVTNAKYA